MTHTESKQETLTICNTSDNTAELESEHQESGYSCDQCQYKADNATLLETHIQAIHESEQCDERDLNNEKDHTNEKPYEVITYWYGVNKKRLVFACKECEFEIDFDTNETCLPEHNCDMHRSDS